MAGLGGSERGQGGAEDHLGEEERVGEGGCEAVGDVLGVALLGCATVEGAVAEVVRMLVRGSGSDEPAELGVRVRESAAVE